MKHFLFTEEISGEQFLVGADTKDEAVLVATSICEDIARTWNENENDYEMHFYGTRTDEEAEMSGLDEY